LQKIKAITYFTLNALNHESLVYSKNKLVEAFNHKTKMVLFLLRGNTVYYL